MDNRNIQVGWTEAQWNRVREEVLSEWQRVRVAGSFLPVYGPLPPSTQVVPSEVIKSGGDVDDADTSRILELYAPVKLSRQLVSEEDLAGAVLQFRRAATALALHEDDVLFNGQYLSAAQAARAAPPTPNRFPAVWLNNTEDSSTIAQAQTLLATPAQASAAAQRVAGRAGQAPPVEAANMGPLGIVTGAASSVVRHRPLSGEDLVTAIAAAVTTLESNGYGRPFVCVLGQRAFIAAHTPVQGSMVLPADRIEPLLGRELLRAKAIDDSQAGTRGIVLSLVGDAIDLAVAAEATPEFTHIGDRGDYNFRVLERVALRIKDNNAIVRIRYTERLAAGATHHIQASTTSHNRRSRTPATVTVTVVDADGNPERGAQVSLTPGARTSTVTPPTQNTDANGEAVFSVSNTAAGAVKYTPNVGGNAIQGLTTSITFT